MSLKINEILRVVRESTGVAGKKTSDLDRVKNKNKFRLQIAKIETRAEEKTLEPNEASVCKKRKCQAKFEESAKVTREKTAFDLKDGIPKRKFQAKLEECRITAGNKSSDPDDANKKLITEIVNKKPKLQKPKTAAGDETLDLDEAINKHRIELKCEDATRIIDCKNRGLIIREHKINHENRDPMQTGKMHVSDPIKCKKVVITAESDSGKCLTHVVRELDDANVSSCSETVDDINEFSCFQIIRDTITTETLKIDDLNEITTLHDSLDISGDNNDTFNDEFKTNEDKVKKSSNTDEGFEFVHENNEFVTYNEIVNNSKSYDGDVVKEIDRVNNNSENLNSNNNMNRDYDTFYQNNTDEEDSPILRSLMIKNLKENEENSNDISQDKMKSIAKVSNDIAQANSSVIVSDRPVKIENNNNKNMINENDQCSNPIGWPCVNNTNEETKSVESNEVNVKDTAPTDLGTIEHDQVKNGKNSH